MTTWGCQHEIHGHCAKVNSLPCDPGMKGCVLAGRFFFLDCEEKNVRRREKLARPLSAPSDETPPTVDD